MHLQHPALRATEVPLCGVGIKHRELARLLYFYFLGGLAFYVAVCGRAVFFSAMPARSKKRLFYEHGVIR